MFRILSQKPLAPTICRLEILALDIARKGKPGQFVILRINECGERFPLTLADQSPQKGTITLVAQAVGKSTHLLCSLKVGEEILDVAGPLGRPTEIEKVGTFVCIGGGVGIAEAYPIARAMRNAGNRVVSIIGGRTRELVIMVDEMRSISDQLVITTDDGSYGEKGLVTDPLNRLISEGLVINKVLAIGPVPMMKAVSSVTAPHRIKTAVSLNPIMVDGTGMCGVCRVTVGGEQKFACVDGPEFDGHQVDYDELMKRQRTYLADEKLSLELFLSHPEKRCYGP